MENSIAPASVRTGRVFYLDNLKSLVILLVVVAHSNVTYSGYGSWYYREADPRSLDFLSSTVFGLFGTFTQAWFMGAMFFMAAYFAARSLARRGPADFVKERLFRLGVPLVIYMFVVAPFIWYFLMNYGDVRSRYGIVAFYLRYLADFSWVDSTGPLWFVEILLYASLLYAAWRSVRPAKTAPSDPPKTMTLILIIVATGLGAFSIRLFFPIGTSVHNLLLCYFAAYVPLFLLGIHAGERGWLEKFPERQGMRWFWTVLQAGPALWGVIMIASGSLEGKTPFNGGLNPSSLVFAVWESFVAIGFTLGLIAFFRKHLDFENRYTKLAADNSFAIYMFHTPVLIAISLFLKDWQAPYLLKHLVVAPVAYAASLCLSFLVLKRIPGLKNVLK